MTKFMQAKFLISAEKLSQCPEYTLPEFPLLGRSNVGKSSFINGLSNNKKLAKTSNTPGKTRLINFFQFGNDFMLADLPGYGYAKRSASEQKQWSELVNNYIEGDTVNCIIQLIDLKVGPTSDDIMMFEWIVESGFEPVVIATKKDKVKPSQREDAIKLIKDTLQIDDVIPFSSEKGDGVDEVWSLFKEMIGVE